MAKSSMAALAQIIGSVARLDRHGKQVVADYLNAELVKESGAKKAEPTKYPQQEE